jgi:hypothetical protein
MRKSELSVLLIASFLFAVGIPSKSRPTYQKTNEPQRQEVTVQEMESFGNDEYYIEFQTRSPEENSIADILWLREAAQVALDAGIPYFSIIHQEKESGFDSKMQARIKRIKGDIKLDNDPMKAQFDANEILALALPTE